jgi:DNA-directed RNA polymerase subunit alpha
MIEKNWKEIIKPSKLEVKEEKNLEFTSTIIAEPLERGYGVTIGNALRRILLSSLLG